MAYNAQLHYLSSLSQLHQCYSQCDVNGVRFVTWDQDQKRKTQNSGVMVESMDNNAYYGVLEEVVELVYPTGMPVILFKCRWFNTEVENMRFDHGLTSIDTSTSWYEHSPYCLAKTARQVFYIDDPKAGENNSSHWKVVISVSHRGIYNDSSIGRSYRVEDAYQEDTPMNIPRVPIDRIQVHDIEVEDEDDDDVDDDGEIGDEDDDDDDSGDNVHGDDEMDDEDDLEDNQDHNEGQDNAMIHDDNDDYEDDIYEDGGDDGGDEYEDDDSKTYIKLMSI